MRSSRTSILLGRRVAKRQPLQRLFKFDSSVLLVLRLQFGGDLCHRSMHPSRTSRQARDPLRGSHTASFDSPVELVYPPEALEARLSGDVTVMVKVDKQGSVAHAEADEGNPVFEQSALGCFETALRTGSV